MGDDSRGVGEPLNETMCGCRGKGCECAGLTLRGSHFLILDKAEEAHALRRALSEQLNFPPVFAFGSASEKIKASTFSLVSKALPPNVKLMTLKNMPAQDGGGVLLRLAHLYEVD